MLGIRKKQQLSLDHVAQSGFHRRLIRYLRRELPDATALIDDPSLLEWIVRGEQRAGQHEILSEAGIAQFVCLTFAAGPEFDEIPEVQQYLAEPGLDPEEKLDELVSYLQDLEANPDAQPDDLP